MYEQRPPPFKKESRIIIIGAGPAGIHLAHLLLSQGFSQVTILERSSRIGGKSCSVYRDDAGGKDIPHEMGACFLHSGYFRVFDLIEKFKCGPYFKNNARHLDRSDVLSPSLSKKKGQPEQKHRFLVKYLLEEIQTIATPRSLWFLPAHLQLVTVSTQIFKYLRLHKSLLGEFEYTLPPLPNEQIMKKLNLSFGELLRQNGLECLIPIVGLGLVAQGYGFIDSLPALYGLWWISPPFIKSLLKARNLSLMVKQGYSTIWKNIYEHYQMNVIFDAQIKSINRSLEDSYSPISIEVSINGEVQNMDCDFLIITSPLKESLDFLSDATNEEKEIFSSLKASTLISTLYRSKVKDSKERAVTYYPDKIAKGHPGRLYAERNSQLAIYPERPPPTDVRFSIAYQYFESESEKDEDSKILLEDLKQLEYEEVEILESRTWNYFPRFDQEGLNNRYPWRIIDMQGTNKTWYAGSSACFESIEDVISYNHLLFRIFFDAKD